MLILLKSDKHSEACRVQGMHSAIREAEHRAAQWKEPVDIWVLCPERRVRTLQAIVNADGTTETASPNIVGPPLKSVLY